MCQKVMDSLSLGVFKQDEWPSVENSTVVEPCKLDRVGQDSKLYIITLHTCIITFIL